ncbi:hypothetical protein GQ43DRAFT_453088 [Delitschia confertaspora ATCC 74209]|uniref:Uncharacterized protein n=1 Tax=Delitschia confertaspora ATCC 74209 TaxID=1513339 RepID=A0A9P4JW49_9PLEO|nr:hypothetical protein GQ43DRAFT_453088 [Delitschia confertaspora ATCC 74209]
MPPALHPRSRATASLFTTTLAISFLVVAAPHLLPCPVDRRALADSADPDALSTDPRRKRRRRVADEAGVSGESENTKRVGWRDEVQRSPIQDEEWGRLKRECPVPKPGGLIAQVLGVNREGDEKK